VITYYAIVSGRHASIAFEHLNLSLNSSEAFKEDFGGDRTYDESQDHQEDTPPNSGKLPKNRNIYGSATADSIPRSWDDEDAF